MLKKLDKCLVICVMLLLVIGLIMIFSASNVTSYMKLDKSPYNFFIRQFIFLIGSLIISFLILRFKTRHYSKLAPTMMIGIIGLLVCVLIYGKVLNESKSWFNIFGLFTVLILYYFQLLLQDAWLYNLILGQCFYMLELLECYF